MGRSSKQFAAKKGRIRRWIAIAASGALIGQVMPMAPGAAAKLRIEGAGLEEAERTRLKSASAVQAAIDADRETPTDLVAAAQADYQRILTALYEEGYYGPSISIRVDGREAAEIPVFNAPGKVSKVVITVEKGKSFKFGRATIAPRAPGTRAAQFYDEGNTAKLARVRGAVEKGVADWRALGHAKAALAEQTITARHDTARLDVDLRLDPGPRLRFGNLIVTGEKRMREERVRAITGLPTGKIFDPEALERAQQRLRETGVFRSATLIEADAAREGRYLDIEAKLDENKLRRFGAGIEYASLDGGKVGGFWMHRNLLGGAERLRFDLEVSQISRSGDGTDARFQVSFTRPATFTPETNLYANAALWHIDEPGYRGDGADVELGLKHRFSKELTASIGLGLERSRITDIFGTYDYTLVTLPATVEWDRRNVKLNPTKGFYLKGDLTPFADVAGGPSGARLYGDARAYYTLDRGRAITLAGRLQFGSVMGSSLSATPATYLFYSGGGGTVRGQKYRSLGVTRGGQLSGGRSFVGLSGELRTQVYKRYSLVGFYDMGFVGADPMPGKNGDWHAGAGLGLRFDTPLGPIRLDVATPTTGPDAGRRAEFYVGIGQAF